MALLFTFVLTPVVKVVERLRLGRIPSTLAEADEIIGMMLAQVLEREGHQAICIPVTSAAEMIEQVRKVKPDIVCNSALPPFAIPHVRALYAKLRAEEPNLRIIVGLWNSSEDLLNLSHRLGLTDGSRAFTKLADFIHEV